MADTCGRWGPTQGPAPTQGPGSDIVDWDLEFVWP